MKQYLAEDFVRFIVSAIVLLNCSNRKVLFLIDFDCFSIDSETQSLLEKWLHALIVFMNQNKIYNFRGAFPKTMINSITKIDIESRHLLRV